jgi:hypothetical protein
VHSFFPSPYFLSYSSLSLLYFLPFSLFLFSNLSFCSTTFFFSGFLSVYLSFCPSVCLSFSLNIHPACFSEYFLKVNLRKQ